MRRRYPAIPAELVAQLRVIEPSKGGVGDARCDYYPCRVELSDGKRLDYVIVAEARSWLVLWGQQPKPHVSIDDVRRIEESPFRLPAALATKLYAAGESGMGYCVFRVVLRDGRQLPFVTGNVVDFPALPTGVTWPDVVDVLPHEGLDRFRDRGPHADESGAPYRWCLFDRLLSA